MNKRNSIRFLVILALISISIGLATLSFFILKGTGIVTPEPSKVSDWVSAIISSFAFVSGAVAVKLAYDSLRQSSLTEEGNLYLKMMERYSSEEMLGALRLLGTFQRENRNNFQKKLWEWNEQRLRGEPKALEIENARHLVKYFYRDLMQLVQARYFSRNLAKRICNTGGRHLFKNVILPMDKVMNVHLFKGEFDPFEEIYEELESEQVITHKGRIICLIPARYDASRFDGKLLKILKGKNGEKTVIRETYERMVSYNIFDDVYVVTNSKEIMEEIKKYNGQVLFYPTTHSSGTDRIAEAVKDIEAEIVFNVQGDEPFIDKEPLQKMIKLMQEQTTPLVVASLMKQMHSLQLIESSDYVKVVTSKAGNAITFSRSVIPHPKKEQHLAKYFEHVGVYAFTKNALVRFTELDPSELEVVESVECLRYLENDIPIKMVETETFLLEIDTENDLENVNKLLESGSIELVELNSGLHNSKNQEENT